MTWKPISSAPRDGSFVLAVDECGNMATVCYRYSGRDNPIVNALAGSDGYWQLFGSAFGFKPTHWSKLPKKLPATAAGRPVERT